MKTNADMKSEMQEEYGREVCHCGDILKELLEQYGISVDDFSVLTGKSIEDVQAIMNGTKQATVKTMIIFARFFNTEPDYWFNIEKNFLNSYFHNIKRGFLSSIKTVDEVSTTHPEL